MCGLSHAQQPAYEYFFGDGDKYSDVLVEKVISLDTLKLQGGNKVILIGVNAPDVVEKVKELKKDGYAYIEVKSDDPTAPLSSQAYEYLVQLVEGKRVRLEMDVVRTSKDNKTLAYVFINNEDNTFVNLELIRMGYVDLSVQPPNTKYAKELRSAYREAHSEKRGLQSE